MAKDPGKHLSCQSKEVAGRIRGKRRADDDVGYHADR
jgi:hypothetical protein